MALIGYGWPPNHCLGNLGIQKFLLPNNNNNNNNTEMKGKRLTLGRHLIRR